MQAGAIFCDCYDCEGKHKKEADRAVWAAYYKGDTLASLQWNMHSQRGHIMVDSAQIDTLIEGLQQVKAAMQEREPNP